VISVIGLALHRLSLAKHVEELMHSSIQPSIHPKQPDVMTMKSLLRCQGSGAVWYLGYFIFARLEHAANQRDGVSWNLPLTRLTGILRYTS